MRQEHRNNWIDLTDNETQRTYFFPQGKKTIFYGPDSLLINDDDSHIIRNFDGTEHEVDNDWVAFSARGSWAFEVEGDPDSQEWEELDPSMTLKFCFKDSDFILTIKNAEAMRTKPSGSIKIRGNDGWIYYIRSGYKKMQSVRLKEPSTVKNSKPAENDSFISPFVTALFVFFVGVVGWGLMFGDENKHSREAKYLSELSEKVFGEDLANAGIETIKLAHKFPLHVNSDDESSSRSYVIRCIYSSVFNHEGEYFLEEFQTECASSKLTVEKSWLGSIGLGSKYSVSVDPSNSNDQPLSAINADDIRRLKSDFSSIIKGAIKTVKSAKEDLAANPL